MELMKTSPAFDMHVEADANFGTKNGWQRVNYFGANAAKGDESRRPAGPGAGEWSPAIEAEHRATREAVGLFDLTSFGKIEVSGPGAQMLLESLCSNTIGRGTGKLTYTQMLNIDGGVISDVTVGQFDDETFLVVTGTSALRHDLEWIQAHAVGRPDVAIRDVTSSWSCFGMWGPRSREVLESLLDTSLDSDSFPYMSTRAVDAAGTPLRLGRVTFVGELGWEIYAPSEFGRSLWRHLSEAVEDAGGLRCGYKAIDSLRAEKGYLYLGADLTADRTPLASGLRPFVRLEKDFVGRDAVLEANAPTELLGGLTLSNDWYLLQGGEQVRFADGRTSTVTSAGLGYTVGSAIAFAYMPVDIQPGTVVEVMIDGQPAKATVVKHPLYDAKGARIRA